MTDTTGASSGDTTVASGDVTTGVGGEADSSGTETDVIGDTSEGADATMMDTSDVDPDSSGQDTADMDTSDASGEPATDGEVAEDQAPDEPVVEMGSEDATSEDEGTTSEPSVTDGSAFTVEQQLASDVDPAAPTTVGIVTWSTTLAVTEAVIEFGLDENYGMVAPVDLDEEGYRTLLLGMKPEREYHYRVVANDGTTTTASDDHVIQTGAATNAVSIGDFNVIDEDNRERGFIVGSYWQGTGASVGFILDADGEIVWWHDFGGMGIARMRMSESGKNMWMTLASNSGGPLQRVGMDGMGGETYAGATGSHDLTPVSGELMAFLEYGESDCDSIFTIDPSGTTEEIWESDELFGGGGGGGGGFGCHGNALRYSQDEDVFTFSDVGSDIVGISRTGEVVWQLTEIVPGGIATWGGRNHGHQLVGDSILIYANDGGQAGASAAIEYDMSSGDELFRYDSGDGTANLGDVQRLPGGNLLVTHSNDSLVHEITADGTLVMEFDGGGSRIGYTVWRETLYGPPPDILE
jgi:hypothetical protein